jgi:hypothetical protein
MDPEKHGEQFNTHCAVLLQGVVVLMALQGLIVNAVRYVSKIEGARRQGPSTTLSMDRLY